MERAAAARPIVSAWGALVIAALSLAGTMAIVELFMRRGLGAYAAPSLHLVAFFVGYDLAVGNLILFAAARRFARERAAGPLPAPAQVPPASVLVAAYDEARGIVTTVRELARQQGLLFDIWVGDDGSSDGTSGALVAAFDLRPVEGGDTHEGWVRGSETGAVALHVVRLPHRGKGATLNALAARAPHPVLITVDADTRPADLALARMASAFVDPAVDSAAGMVIVRNPRSWLTRHQAAEYLKTSVVRIGWSSLGALEQVPGAFAGLRATSFRAAGGFPTDSLTEDYEMTFRLLDLGVRSGRFPVVVTVPDAKVYTDVPDTFRGFVRQRTRWFAGFLTTLVRFRHLIGSPAAQSVRSWCACRSSSSTRCSRWWPSVRSSSSSMDATAPRCSPISRVTLGLFLMRWVWDLAFYARGAAHQPRLPRPAGARRSTTAPASDGLALHRDRGAHLRLVEARGGASARTAGPLRRTKRWEPSREPQGQAD